MATFATNFLIYSRIKLLNKLVIFQKNCRFAMQNYINDVRIE